MFIQCLANAICEGTYFLGTAIARPLIAKDKLKLRTSGVDAVAHGATGKGNDQVRFESVLRKKHDIKVISPLERMGFKSRNDLINFGEKHQIQLQKIKEEKPLLVQMQICCILLLRAKFSRIRGLRRLNMFTQEQKSLENSKAEPVQEITVSFKNGDVLL